MIKNNRKNLFKNNHGFAAIFATILILVFSSVVITSVSYIAYNSIKSARNNIYSAKAYYAAESGVEDSLLRLSKGMNYASSNNLTVDNVSATISISNPVGGSKIITVIGDKESRIRKVRVVYAINSSGISFHYGAQAGEGGIEMSNNSRIKGNVFSNGSVIGPGIVDNSIIVAHNGNKIKDLNIGQDALAYTCENSTLGGKLVYIVGGMNNCSAHGGTTTQSSEIGPEDMPISDLQINSWKQQAVLGGTNLNNVVYNGTSNSLGPIQIGTSSQPKNLLITNNAHLKITGTVYVTGNITFDNNSIIELDNTYGSLSGMIIADGKISVNNNSVLRGSGASSSYILILSTNSSISPSSPAISVNNNAAGAIFYTNNGMIYLGNNMKVREVTGYKLKINNNAIIEYESGLENAIFSSGPGGSGGVIEWKEIE
jgi:hypothetical protein